MSYSCISIHGIDEVRYCEETYREFGIENSPEINELDTDKKALKIWAHNSKKQKRYSIFSAIHLWFRILSNCLYTKNNLATQSENS